MRIVVRKYGGTSLADADRVRRAVASVADLHATGTSVVLVVSAQGDTTDELLGRAATLGGSAAGRETDQLLATGEIVSAALAATALAAIGVPAVSLTGAQAGVVAEGPPGAGRIADVDTTRIARHLAERRVVVVAGFQGVDAAGDVLTLGRGGSDTTAVALAAALDADACEIYTDVDGIYSAAPRVVPGARVLPEVPAEVAVEMSFAGAKVLHSRAAELAAARDIELRVRNALRDSAGTTVRRRGAGPSLEGPGVLAVCHELDVVRVLIRCDGPRRDLAGELLSVLAEYHAPLDLVARSGPFEDEFRMGFTMQRGDLDRVAPELRRRLAAVGATLVLDEHVAKVSLVGVGLLSRPGYTAALLAELTAAGIPTSWLFTSQLRTSVTVPLDRALDAVALLHRKLVLDQDWSMASR
ncbi:aspartate kinase [Plantactinospora sp. B5E13]|uniref:aspartate kinase n=1 Tax=unclassified Plantactinospora TaxID=2631981 RepID=UPI00325E3404